MPPCYNEGWNGSGDGKGVGTLSPVPPREERRRRMISTRPWQEHRRGHVLQGFISELCLDKLRACYIYYNLTCPFIKKKKKNVQPS